jgi:hypothetical protein
MRYVIREYDVGRVRFSYTRMFEHQTDAELKQRLEDYKQRLVAACSQGLRRISILEFAVSNQYSAQQRRIQSDWNRECDALLRAAELELIFVTPSALMRGVITAVFWVAPPPFAYEVCADLSDALNRAFEVCERFGVRVDHRERARCTTLFQLDESAHERAASR